MRIIVLARARSNTAFSLNIVFVWPTLHYTGRLSCTEKIVQTKEQTGLKVLLFRRDETQWDDQEIDGESNCRRNIIRITLTSCLLSEQLLGNLRDKF
jgi:hypothetical protein